MPASDASVWTKLKKPGHANSDCKHTFMKQFTCFVLVNPLFNFSKSVISNWSSGVKFRVIFWRGFFSTSLSGLDGYGFDFFLDWAD